jgi:outer membrane protein assembly factor BamA
MKEIANVIKTASSPVWSNFLVLAGLLAGEALPRGAARAESPATQSPIVREVIYKNAHHLKPDELNMLTGIRRGVPLDPAWNIRACSLIQEEYRRKGRLFASVTLEEGKAPGDNRVVFNITEGPVLRIRAIRFTGNDPLTTSRLTTQTDTKKSFPELFASRYNPTVTEHNVRKLEEDCKANGYFDVRATHELLINDDLRTVDVVFHIHEGTRYRVGAVSTEGIETLDRNFVRTFLRVRQGEFYNQSAVETDVRNIIDLYGYRGYLAAVEKRLEFPEKTPGIVNVHYKVTERAPARTSNIIIDNSLRVGPIPALDFGFPVVREPHERPEVLSFFLGLFK